MGAKDDLGRGAVVPGKPELPEGREIFFESCKIAQIRTPETIDRLVRVADNENTLAFPGPGFDQAVLNFIDILELIYQQIGAAVPAFKALQRFQEDIVIIHYPVTLKLRTIGIV